MDALENIAIKIDTALPKLSTNNLLITLDLIQITAEGKEHIQNNKRKMIRLIQKYYEEIIEDEEQDQNEILKLMQQLYKHIEGKLLEENGNKGKDDQMENEENKGVSKEASNEGNNGRKGGIEVNDDDQNTKKGNVNEVKIDGADRNNGKPPMNGKPPNEDNDTTTDTPNTNTTGMFQTHSLRELGYLSQQTSLLRKDFKIKGVIGNPGQKDRLSFVSLTHQINEGKSAGYSEKEIVAGVLKAMAPNLRLRNVLETMADLTLERLNRFLQAHFEEGNAPDLCSQLTSMTQLSEESVYQFVIRCLEMRQKVIVASKQADDIMYDPNLVQQLFLRTLERGIASPYILSEIKPYLKPSCSDESLIIAVTRASAAERDREENFSSKHRKLRGAVHKVDIPEQNDDSSAKLTSFLESFEKRFANLEKKFESLQLEQNPKGAYRGTQSKDFRCSACKQKNLSECWHCFKCCAEGHTARFCPKQGN